MLLALLLLFAPVARAREGADPGGSSMGSLIMGSWKQAQHEGHSDFCFTGLAVTMNAYHRSNFGSNAKESEEMSGYYNSVTTYFMTPNKPAFSITVYEPNGKGPNDPTFPLYNYMSHIDGDETIGHRECIGKLDVDYPRAVSIAAKMGLITATGNSQYLELRMASGPEEPGWSEKKLRGKTYWMVGESVKGVIHEYYIDAVTGKPLLPRTTRSKAAPTTQPLKAAEAKGKGLDAPPAK